MIYHEAELKSEHYVFLTIKSRVAIREIAARLFLFEIKAFPLPFQKMKTNILLCLFFTLLTMGCDKNCGDERGLEDAIEIPHQGSVFGTWQLAYSYEWTGEVDCGAVWKRVEKGYSLTIHADSSFTSTRFSQCREGKAAITQKEIALTYACPQLQLPDDDFLSGKHAFKYRYRFVNGKIEMTQLSPVCYEGCTYRFIKP